MTRRRKRRGTARARALQSSEEVQWMNHLEVHIPERLALVRRPTASPRSDELPTLRDASGRVLATVEQWAPESGTMAKPS